MGYGLALATGYNLRKVERMKTLITMCCCFFRIGLSVSVGITLESKYLNMLLKAFEIFEQIR